MTVLMEGISFGESPRWHDGRVWFSDWGAHQVIAVDPEGGHEVVVSVPSFPMGFDFPGGEPEPGSIVLVTPEGAVRLVADGLAFPNGMAITADGSTLIVAES